MSHKIRPEVSSIRNPESTHVDSAPGTVIGSLLGLAWPSALEQFLMTLAALANIAIVGQLGRAAIAGVGLGLLILTVASALFSVVGVGASILVAQQSGARLLEDANRTLGQATILAVLLGVGVAAVCGLLAHPIIGLFGPAADVVSAGSTWLRIAAPSFALSAVLLIGSSVLRGAADTRTPMVIMTTTNAIHVALAWLLTGGFFGLPKLGVAGSAIGMAVGQVCGGVLMALTLGRGQMGLRLGRPGLRPNWSCMRRILRVGLPVGAEQVILQTAIAYLSVILLLIGTAALAAYQISLQVASLAFMLGWSLNIAVTTLVGQAVGAKSPNRARALVNSAWCLATVIMLGGETVLYLFRYHVLGLFTQDPDVIQAGSNMLLIITCIQPLMAASFVFSGALYGAGDTRTTMLIAVVSTAAIRPTVAYVAGIMLNLGLFGVWLGIAADYLFRAVLYWSRFRSGRWLAQYV